MSFQVPGGMLITGAMLQFYRTTPQVVFWQWFNQSFNALVNYTNRNASVPTDFTQMGLAYVSATSAALGTALGLKTLLAKSSSPLLQRFVPCVAVAASNCVNIPLMRQVELREGMTLSDEKGDTACLSRNCAADGIGKVNFNLEEPPCFSSKYTHFIDPGDCRLWPPVSPSRPRGCSRSPSSCRGWSAWPGSGPAPPSTPPSRCSGWAASSW